MIELSEYEIKLMNWSIRTSINALVLEKEQDEPALSEKSSALLIRRLSALEEKLADYYEDSFMEN